MTHLEHQRLGAQGPTLLFFNGFRMPMSSWQPVADQVAEKAQCVLFNRPGIGRSPKAEIHQTGEVVVDMAHELATDLTLKSPLVLVAHSVGGIFANLYARTFPDQVAGIVFVDATHPEEVMAQKQIKPPGLLHGINQWLKAIEKMIYPLKYSEDECMGQTIEQIHGADDFPDIPITVISGTQKMPFVPQKNHDIHLDHQQKLRALSSQSHWIECSGSGHFPQITEPEKVAQGIVQTLDEIC